MNLQVNPDVKYSGIKKQAFQLKNSRRDGLILQVHHTIPTANGQVHRVWFVHVAFDETGEILAASDHRGNVFIIDLSSEKFWKLPNLGSCTMIAFPPTKRNELLIGTVNCSLQLMNIELGNVTGKLDGHTVPPKQVTFSSSSRYCLTAAAQEAVIWDLDSNTQAHRLSLRMDVAVKQVIFMPVSDNILACFQDDAIHIWEFDTFVFIKQILPEAWKSHRLKSIAFTRNGRAMAIGGHSPLLVVFCLDDWCVKKVIKLPEYVSGVQHIEFIPQLFDAGANKILGLLSSQCVLYFLDTESSLFLKNVFDPQISISRFMCSCSGKYVACILQSGEVNIYRSCQLLEAQSQKEPVVTERVHASEQHDVKPEKKMTTHYRIRRASKRNLLKVQKQIKETLDLNRLRPLLKEFGEYPDSYRSVIWRTILQLPCNQPLYMSLVKREVHPAYLHLEEQYPLENKSVLKHLKRLLSCLAHWSPFLSEVKFLPLFVFPFVKVFQNDPLICFEAVTTIILNWCQHWFEYFPYPPINVLSMIEHVLAEHDPELLEFYYRAGVKTVLYAWSLLEVAFSEVLSSSEWLCLWDHVLSNEPSFLLMAVVAYNIVCRRMIMSCQDHDDFEHFFHNQNPIDMKWFISNIYMLYNKTKKEVHPRQFLTAFRPLEKGSYPVFMQYPKFITDYKARQIEQIRKEEENILKEYQTAMKQKAEQEKRMHEAVHTEIQEKCLKELEEVYQETLHKEEERVAEHRQKVLALRKNLRVRELELLNAAKDRLMRQNVQQRHTALSQLLHDIRWKRAQEETEVAAAEEEIRQHYLELQSHKHNLEQKPGATHSVMPPHSVKHQALWQQQELLADELRKLRSEATSEHEKLVNNAVRVAEVDELWNRSELELARELAEGQHNLQSGQKSMKVIQLETETKKLEKELEQLLEHLTDAHVREGTAWLHEVVESEADRRTFNREQEEQAQLQQSDLSSNFIHPSWDQGIHLEQPEELRQQEWNSKHYERKRVVPSRSGASLYTNTDRMPNKWSSTSTDYRGPLPSPVSRAVSATDTSVRSAEFYRQEQDVVLSAMDIREQIVSKSDFL